MRKFLIPLASVVTIAIIGFLLATSVIEDGTARATTSNNILTGDYHQVKNKDASTQFSATIREGEIKIVLLMDSGEEGDADAAGTYWAGTFDTSNTSDVFQVLSQGDTETMSYSVLGSQDKTKVFEYDNGILSFRFTVMGITETIYLSK